MKSKLMKSHNLMAACALFVALAPHAAIAVTWDGGGTDGNWLTGANWAGDTAPSAGDALGFEGSVRTTNTNDFTADTIFDSISLNAANFNLSGDAVQLSSALRGWNHFAGNWAGGDNRHTGGNPPGAGEAVRKQRQLSLLSGFLS
jgi:hypothetical protein